jgi:hypothetical protein
MDVLEQTKFIVADQWQRLGVGVDIIGDPPARRGDQEYRATFPGFDITRGGAGVESFKQFHSSEIRVAETRFVGQNVPNYANPEFDALLDRYHVTIPRVERMRVAGQIVHHMTDQVIVLNMFYDATPLIVSNRLLNVSTNMSRGGTTTWNAHEWQVK